MSINDSQRYSFIRKIHQALALAMQSENIRQFRPRVGPTPAAQIEGVDYDYMMAEPEPLVWAVENIFLSETVGLISGNGGAGKSTLMMQLATCATLGLPWLGYKVQPGRALMLACEDDRRIVRLRQRWINRALDRDMADVLDAGLDIIPRAGRDNTLMEPERWTRKMERTPLFEQLILRCRRTGIQLVIIDTVAKTFGGQSFNERQVTQFVDEMQRFAELIHGVVLLTQHPSMSGRKTGTGESGTVQWESAVRSRLYVHKHQALGLVLEQMKSNYAAKAPPMKIEWRQGIFEPVETPAQDYSERYDA
jgi:RecA-family ATPase